jgi:sulfatase-modifying factor enzyme 1
MTGGRRAVLTGVVLGLVGGCTNELEPFGEAVLIVDTDVSPQLANELRVDVYTQSGAWIESRTFLRASERDWPASFSIVAPTDEQETEALVRLRLYPTGGVRDYRGERFEPRPTFVPLDPPHSVEEMCSEPPVVVPGEVKRVRHTAVGFSPRFAGGACGGVELLGGTGALALDIAETGTYRIGVVGTVPSLPEVSFVLQLRSSCADEASLVACAPPGSPSVDVVLAPGRYFIVTDSADPWATPSSPGGLLDDISWGPLDAHVGVAITSAWNELDTSEYHVDEPLLPPDPLRMIDGATPADEPLPGVTVDRLVRVRLRPGVVGTVRTVLRGECFGTMARLRADWPNQPPVLDEAETCVDMENTRVPLLAEEAREGIEPPAASERVGTFPADVASCDGELASPTAVCVPGGAFVLGAPGGSVGSFDGRIAVMSRFWIDRYEVTVSRWRLAVALGLAVIDYDGPQENEQPLATSDTPVSNALCTYSLTRSDRDDYPLNCVKWPGARAFCRFFGGDLPTEAQWEYVATRAGRARETWLPWGDDPPVCSPTDCLAAIGPCHAAVFHRSTVVTRSQCLSSGFGIAPVTSYADPIHGDVSVPLGADPSSTVTGLAGGLAEALLDSFRPYDTSCDRAMGLRDPACWEEESPRRARRGAGWADTRIDTYSAKRGETLGVHWIHSYVDGFRCVYPTRPSG